MKTRLFISDPLLKEAKKEAERSGRSISEVISFWATIGRDACLNGQPRNAIKAAFQPLDLGTPKIDLSIRRHWMDKLG
jgi:hypothetical protein